MTVKSLTRRNFSVAISALFIVGSAGASAQAAATTFTAAAQTAAVAANASVAINLTANASLPTKQAAYIQGYSSSGTHGTIAMQSNATTMVYTPGSYFANFVKGSTATDKFSFCLKDTAGAISCSTATVTVTGTAVAPAAAAVVTANATTYTCVRNFYVSPTGSDKAAGTTASVPWQTVQHANDSGLLKAGDCVNLATGTYSVTKSVNLTHGGSANSATGYVVYRATTSHGAKIKAAAQNMVDVVDVQGDYVIVDGLEIDGSNLGLVSSPFTTGSGLMSTGHHFQAVNNLVHDCGGEGIGALYKDWYWIVGNTVYNNARFNGYHMSGISIYEPRAVSFTATAADTSAVYHIVVKNNVSHDNAETYVKTAHTDGNGIILDDFRNTQNPYTPYAYKSLVQGNTTYNNGGRGIHVFSTDNVTVDSNVAYNNNLDTLVNATWRGELSNAFGSNNSWSNNKAAATSLGTGVRLYNTAVLDGHSGASNVNVVWTNNANFDTRTGGKSYQIDDAARAAAFPINNLLGTILN